MKIDGACMYVHGACIRSMRMRARQHSVLVSRCVCERACTYTHTRICAPSYMAHSYENRIKHECMYLCVYDTRDARISGTEVHARTTRTRATYPRCHRRPPPPTPPLCTQCAAARTHDMHVRMHVRMRAGMYDYVCIHACKRACACLHACMRVKAQGGARGEQ